MRIIGGNKAGLRINPTKLKLRPTTDRSKEALFNILYNKIDYHGIDLDKKCIDDLDDQSQIRYMN